MIYFGEREECPFGLFFLHKKIYKFYISNGKEIESDKEYTFNNMDDILKLISSEGLDNYVRLYFNEKISFFRKDFKWFYLIISNKKRYEGEKPYKLFQNLNLSDKDKRFIEKNLLLALCQNFYSLHLFDDIFELIKIYLFLSAFSCDEIKIFDEPIEFSTEFNPWDNFKYHDLGKEKLPLMGEFLSKRIDELGCRKIYIYKKNISEVYNKMKSLFCELDNEYFSINLLMFFVIIHEFGHCAFDNNYFKRLKITSEKKEKQANFYASYKTNGIFDRLTRLLSLIQSEKYKNPLLISSIVEVGYDQFFNCFWDLFEE